MVAVLRKSHFLKMLKLENSKADTIFAELTSYLSDIHISLSHVSSFGSDGDAVMIGSSRCSYLFEST